MSKEIIVIKLGGSIFESKDTSLQDIAALYKEGKKMVVVHGGAAKVSEWLDKMDIPVKIVNGERATTKDSLEVVTAVLAGLINKEICASLLDMGVKACGISAVDGASVIGKMRGGEMGLMGDVACVNTELIHTLLEKGFVPVVSPVSYNEQKTRDKPQQRLLNINGDPIAGALAHHLDAELLVFITDTDGVKDKQGKTIKTMSAAQAKEMIENGTAYGGMIPKLNAAALTSQNDTKTAIVSTPKNVLGKFVMTKDRTGQYRFDLISNDEVIGIGGPYKTSEECKNAIENIKSSVFKASVEDQSAEYFEPQQNPKFEIFKNKDDTLSFRLKAKNGEIIMVGNFYTQKKKILQIIEKMRESYPLRQMKFENMGTVIKG